MAFMIPVVKKNYDLYSKSAPNRHASESSVDSKGSSGTAKRTQFSSSKSMPSSSSSSGSSLATSHHRRPSKVRNVQPSLHQEALMQSWNLRRRNDALQTPSNKSSASTPKHPPKPTSSSWSSASSTSSASSYNAARPTGFFDKVKRSLSFKSHSGSASSSTSNVTPKK